VRPLPEQPANHQREPFETGHELRVHVAVLRGEVK
jgi:hypothetical protein